MKIEVKKVEVKTNAGARERNERSLMKHMQSNRRDFELPLDTVIVNGWGARKLFKYVGATGIEIILDEIQEKLDEIPVYSELEAHIMISEYGMKLHYVIKFVKQSEETRKFLAEYHIPMFND